MKLKISYATRQRKYFSPNVYQHISKYAELEPVRIIRVPCGSGKAAKRYYYLAQFVAPADADFVTQGMIRANVNRKANPKFNPKKLDWVDDVADKPYKLKGDD